MGKRRDFMNGLRVDGDRNMSVQVGGGHGGTARVAFLGKVKKIKDRGILHQTMWKIPTGTLSNSR